MYLSYSGHKAYKECPRQYWHRYVGKTKLPAPDNRVNALYGSVVGTLFEDFYTQGIWKQSGVQQLLEARVDQTIDSIIQRESRDGVFDWADPKSNYKSRESLRREVVKSIPRGIGIIRHHRLLGHRADAEVKLDANIDGHMIGGRADFIIQRVKPHNDLVILDGKGSRHRDKYVDPQQLWWYAMLYRHHHTILPDRLGFVFWRQEPENSLDWVNFSGKSLDDLLAGVLGDVQNIEAAKARLTGLKQPITDPEYTAALRELFPAQVGGKCGLCSYLPVCQEGQAYQSRRPDLSDLHGFGVDDVGF